MEQDENDLSMYQCVVVLKGTNEPIYGSVVSFYVHHPNGQSERFPNAAKGINFAFCPLPRLREFESSNGEFKSFPEYVILVRKDNVERFGLRWPITML